MGTLVKGRIIRKVGEKIFIKTKTKEKTPSGKGVKKTSEVEIKDTYPEPGKTILVGVGVQEGEYVMDLKIGSATVDYDQIATDDLNNSTEMAKKFKDVNRWYGFKLSHNPGANFDTTLALDPFPHDRQTVPIVAWYREDNGLKTDHWLYGYSTVTQPDVPEGTRRPARRRRDARPTKARPKPKSARRKRRK
jgi:hypothetical protein